MMKSEEEIVKYLDELKREVYSYNAKISGSGFYLKPYHIVYKDGKRYVYIGRYWYKLEKKGRKLKWKYLGKQKPDSALPDPPELPELEIVIYDDNEIVVK